MKLARTREWRESHGLTQRELAAEAGVGEVTVARIETGASVTPPTARKIAEALGVAVVDLLERPLVPLAEAPETGPPDSLLYWIEKLEAERNSLTASYDRVLNLTPAEQKRLAELNALLKVLVARHRELAPPLAQIERRLLEPDPSKPFREKVRVVFLRPPTPEERAKLKAEYPDAEVVETYETEETDLVKTELVYSV